MLAYLDNHVREIGVEIWWGGKGEDDWEREDLISIPYVLELVLLEVRAYQNKEILYTQHQGGRYGCVWEEVRWGSNIISWTAVRYYL